MAALLDAGQELSAAMVKERKPYAGSRWSRLPGTPVACADDPALTLVFRPHRSSPQAQCMLKVCSKLH